MSDRELLELAAKAAGYGEVWYLEGYDTPYIGPRYTGGTPQYTTFKPLTDDGDALRLAVTVAKKWRGLWLKMQVDSIESVDRTSVSVTGLRYCYSEEWGDEGDPLAATRRAIVRAAAEIGRAMK